MSPGSQPLATMLRAQPSFIAIEVLFFPLGQKLVHVSALSCFTWHSSWVKEMKSELGLEPAWAGLLSIQYEHGIHSDIWFQLPIPPCFHKWWEPFSIRAQGKKMCFLYPYGLHFSCTRPDILASFHIILPQTLFSEDVVLVRALRLFSNSSQLSCSFQVQIFAIRFLWGFAASDLLHRKVCHY